MKRSDDGWIEWKGGECPVAAAMKVQVKHRNGVISMPFGDFGGTWRWQHTGYPSDIIAYRVVEDASDSHLRCKHGIIGFCGSCCQSEVPLLQRPARQHISDAAWEKMGPGTMLPRDYHDRCQRSVGCMLVTVAEWDELGAFKRAIEEATGPGKPTGFINEKVIVCAIEHWKQRNQELAARDAEIARLKTLLVCPRCNGFPCWCHEKFRHSLLTLADPLEPRLGRK